MEDDGSMSLIEAIGRLSGDDKSLSLHLFGAIANVLINSGLATDAQVADALDGQAERANDRNATMLRTFADEWRSGGPPKLTLVE